MHQWTRYYDNAPALPLPDEALAVAVTSAGDLTVTGAAYGSSTFEDIGTIVTYSGGGIFSDGFETGDVSRWSNAVGD